MSDLPPPLRDADWHARLRRLGEALGASVAAAWAVHARRLRARVVTFESDLLRALQTSGNASEVIERVAAAVGVAGRTFSDELQALSANGAREGWMLGVEAAEQMIGVQLNPARAAQLANLRGSHAEMMRQLDRIVNSEAFRASVARFGANIGSKASDLLLYGLAQGYNPRRTASILSNYIDSVPRVWAETTARTAQLYAYRRASHETYRANADVVTGWIWWSARDARTCLSCLSLHGQKFPLGEELNDHHRGRCIIPGEMVKTRRGDVPVESVRVGDEVYTHAGNWRRVVRLYRRDYSGDVITVCSGDHAVTVTPEHPVLTQRGWVEASDLSASDTFLTLVSSDVRESRCSTVQPNAVSRRSLRWSTGRLTGELCQGGSHSTASLTSGNAKSMLYDNTASCGTGANPCDCSTSRKCRSSSDMRLSVRSRITACFSRVLSRWPASINGLRKSGLRSIWRWSASLAEIGVMSHSRINRISDRVLIPTSAHSSRYDAPSTSYLRLSQTHSGSPMRALNSESQRAEFMMPTVLGSMRIPSVLRRWWTARSVRPSATAISPAVRIAEFWWMKASSSSDHFLPAMWNLRSTGNSIHHSRYAGKVYDLEVEGDHSFFAGGIAVHNCAALPIVRGSTWANSVQSGPEWFAGLDAVRQREMMGPGLYAAYRDGEVDWSRMSVTYRDPVYGVMRRQATLRELGLGGAG